MLALALAVLTLSACGGSSKGSTASGAAGASTSSTPTTPAGGAPGKLRGRFAALRECLQRDGITLPSGVGLLAATRQLPNGVTRAQFDAAVRKCGGAAVLGALNRLRGGKLKGLALGSRSLKAQLTKFVACMRAHGVNLPAPNTSGGGPIFNTAGINTRSPQFLSASAACRQSLFH
jgi:hypothetical protein